MQPKARTFSFLSLLLFLSLSARATELDSQRRLLADFTGDSEDLKAWRTSAKNCEILSKNQAKPDSGITVRSAKGEGQASLTLPKERLKNWGIFDHIEVEIEIENEGSDKSPAALQILLSDRYTNSWHTQCHLSEKLSTAKTQKLSFRYTPARRYNIDPVRRWFPVNRLDLLDALDPNDLRDVSLFWDRKTATQFTLRTIYLVRKQDHPFLPKIASHQEWLRLDFETPTDIKALQEETENVDIHPSSDKGITNGKTAARITAKQGKPWASFTLGQEALKGCEAYDFVALDVYLEGEQSYPLNFELFDEYSHDLQTRHTRRATIHPGQQTLLFRVKDAEPNQTRGAAVREGLPWKAARPEKMQLDHLRNIKFWLTPAKNSDTVFWVDQIRFVRKQKPVVLYEVDFEEDKYLQGQGPYYGHWTSNQGMDTLSIQLPKGEGAHKRNRSKGALTYTAKSDSGHFSAETTSTRDNYVELDGWNGGVSFKFYNGGFKSFYVIYLPTVPVDTTFYRAYFNVPEGTWAEINLPLDRFLCHGLRPRRGSEVERLVFVGLEPQGEKPLFQVDDIQMYRTRRRPAFPVKKPPLPEGILYRQNFDDPHDFDVEGFNTESKQSEIFWAAEGHVDATQPKAQGETNGCLKIKTYGRGVGIMSGRRIRIHDGDIVEFDAKIENVRNFVFKARGPKKYVATKLEAPPTGGWKHYRITLTGMPAKRNRFVRSGIYFTGRKNAEDADAVIWVDNVLIRRATTFKD